MPMWDARAFQERLVQVSEMRHRVGDQRNLE
jgi:hypothetical protein